MPDSPTSEPESAFVCDCVESMRSACVGEPFYKEHEGKRYCVLHFPGKQKSSTFQKALQRKLDDKDFNFQGVWFPDEVSFCKFHFSAVANFSFATFSAAAYFNDATFSEEADFSGATFSADAQFSSTFSAAAHFNSAAFRGAADFSFATFSANVHFISAAFKANAYFISTTFRVAHFVHATFNRTADFSSTTFAAADFMSAIFAARANFRAATFSGDACFSNATANAELDFHSATFNMEANFESATLADRVRFAGDEKRPMFSSSSSLDLQFARIEKPDHVSFHTLSLRPHWFVNVDGRKFDFTNVDWYGRSIDEEIRTLEDKSVSSPYRLLAIACRNLAVNAEENHRYEEASRFRYMAMERYPRKRWRGPGFWRLSWWYWLASGYGERVTRAFLVLLGIWFLSALLYNHVGFARWEPKLASEADVVSAKRDDVGAPLKFIRALTYSAGVMTLQKPEPRPATTVAQTVVLLETILGPVQAALLALAIRRKFMR